MPKELIVVPELYEPRGNAHAVKVGNVVYTTGLVARDKNECLVGRGDISAQARKVYENLDLVLRAAGATWNDVAKYSAYLVHPEDRREAREIHYQYVPLYQRAGATVVMPLADPEMLLEVELVAYIGTPKHCITNVPDVYVPMGAPHAVKVGDTIHVTGQQPVAGRQPLLGSGPVADAGAHENQVVGRGDFEAQNELVYRNLGAILKASGVGWDDVVWAHNYLTSRDYFELHRSVRFRYLTMGKVAMTSVICPLVGPDWLIETQLVASTAPKEVFMAPGVAVTPGTAHAVRAGNTIYVQGQVARDLDGNPMGRGDIVAQTERVYQNIDDILRTAGSGLRDVVFVKAYFKNREDIAVSRETRGRFLPNGTYASTAVVAGFFHPDYLLEAEAIAVVE